MTDGKREHQTKSNDRENFSSHQPQALDPAKEIMQENRHKVRHGTTGASNA